jgi:hypothetical protein
MNSISKNLFNSLITIRITKLQKQKLLKIVKSKGYRSIAFYFRDHIDSGQK